MVRVHVAVKLVNRPSLTYRGERQGRWHYAVTQARRVGKLDLLACQKIAGHSSPDITLEVYSHLFSSDIADAVDAFDPFALAASN